MCAMLCYVMVGITDCYCHQSRLTREWYDGDRYNITYIHNSWKQNLILFSHHFPLPLIYNSTLSFSLLPIKPQLLPFLFVLVDLPIVFDLRIEPQEHGIMWDMFGPNIKGKRCVRLLQFKTVVLSYYHNQT